MHKENGLWILGNLYSICHGKPKFWPEALEDTKDSVRNALRESADNGGKAGAGLESFELSNLSAFLHNRNCLEHFVKSEFFVKEKHIPLLVNLLRLAYKVAASFDASVIEYKGYEYVFSGDDIDILELCGMGSNEKAGNIILRNKIDEEEY